MFRQCSNAPVDARVAHDWRLRRHRRYFDEPALVDVGEVDEDPERLAPLHDRASEGGQPLVIPPTSSVGREADLVRAEVREAEVAHAPAREGVEARRGPPRLHGPPRCPAARS